ncbi:hypothetical protein SAMN02746095_03176 [Acidocella aminolytica 101 = DSM 11237]|nr:hypothetical protein SAMN02746095_03176 [Acidocella aminolytica 101 = DSM 11237]
MLRTAQPLTNVIVIFCIISWRIFLMPKRNHSAPAAEPTLALDKTETGLLDRLVQEKIQPQRKTLREYLTKIA